MDNLKELNRLLLKTIDEYMDATEQSELSLLDVLTDAYMEIEEFLYERNQDGNDCIKH